MASQQAFERAFPDLSGFVNDDMVLSANEADLHEQLFQYISSIEGTPPTGLVKSVDHERSESQSSTRGLVP
jgi:hypothetical protein